MSKTSTALIVKFLMTFVAAAVAFALFGNIAFTTMGSLPWLWLAVVALIGTAINYLVGDLYVLPKYGNIIASAGDGIMAALVALIVARLSAVFDTTLSALVLFAILVAVGEYYFHRYLKKSEEVAP